MVLKSALFFALLCANPCVLRGKKMPQLKELAVGFEILRS
jgi:hypothetical protein